MASAEPNGSTSARTTESSPGPETDAGGETLGSTEDLPSSVDAASPRPTSQTGSLDAGATVNYHDASINSETFTYNSTLTGSSEAAPTTELSASAPGRDAAVGNCASGGLCLVSTTPSHDSENVSTATHVLLEFNRPVYAGSGILSILASASGLVFEQMPLTDSRVSIDGPMVTVDLDGVLAGETNYTVTVSDAALNAGAETTFEGLIAGDLSFTTAKNELPIAHDELLLWVDPSFEASLKLEAAV